MSVREKRLMDLLSRMISTLVMMQMSIERGQGQRMLELEMNSALRHLKTACPTLLTWVQMVYRDEKPPYELRLIGEVEATEGLTARL